MPKGTVVVARTLPTALLIWDASPAVGDLVVARRSGDDAMRELEIQAVRILAARASTLHASRVEVRVQYAPTGVVGAAYQASTFANETPMFVLKTERARIRAHASQWIADLSAQRRPTGLAVTTVGAFPAAQ